MADTFDDDQVTMDDQAPSNTADVEMSEVADPNNGEDPAEPTNDNENDNNKNDNGNADNTTGDADNTQLPFAEGGENDPDARVTFISYLSSPVVTLLVGDAGAETVLTAHQALLVQSPWFAEACALFSDDVVSL